MFPLGKRKVINQTSFVDVFVVETSTTTISSTSSISLPESSTPAISPASEIMSAVEEDSPAPTDPPSMFSTSMVPPRPTPAGQKEELITTVAPTIQEEEEDIDHLTDFDVDEFESENVTYAEFVSLRGDTFQENQNTLETTDATESMSMPVEEADDLSVIEINTVQPDVPIPDASLITEPMFAEGKTEEAILDSGITTAMASDLTDTPQSAEPTSEELFSSSETMATVIYDSGIDEIETAFPVEALPPTLPPQQTLSSSPSDSTDVLDTTFVTPTDTTFLCNTQPGSKVEITTTRSPETTHKEHTQTSPQMQDVDTPTVVYMDKTQSAPVTSSPILLDSEMLTEDVSKPASVDIFDESSALFPEHSSENIIEDDTTREIDKEFFTFVTVASAVAHTPTVPSTAITDQRAAQPSTSGKRYKLIYFDPMQMF